MINIDKGVSIILHDWLNVRKDEMIHFITDETHLREAEAMERWAYGTCADRKHNTRCGEYRKEPSKIGMLPKEINRELAELIKDYEQQPADMGRILDFHVRFERIRPFDDYNGRVGRVIMLKECLRHDVTPFIIDDKRRGEYNCGIAQWDTNPEVLRSASLRAQGRFQAQLELCKLMQYRRPPKN